MNRLLIILSLLLAGMGMGRAQEFKEGLLYDLQGNVKEMKLSTKNSFLKKHVKFRDNGKLKKSITFFDDDNYPLGFDMSMNVMSFAMSQKVEYDSCRRITSVTDKNSYDGGITTTTSNYYGNEAAPSEITRSVFASISKDGEVTADCEYSGYVYDDHGNWISRQVKHTATRTDKKGVTEEGIAEYT
ncbi:MAG: hypothetical protein K1V75_03035 [Muribaculaceae bacterium]